ncbi:MAG: sigma 54-interacting transcriptional regulator [Pseudomonadales bacterium]
MSRDPLVPIEEAPLWMALLDGQGNCLGLNAAWRSDRGVDRDGTAGLRVSDLLPVRDAPTAETIRQAIAGGERIEALSVTLADGSNGSGRLWLWPVASEPEPVTCLMLAPSVPQDAEGAEHLHRRHELILEAIGEGIYGLDDQGRATFVNRAATEILGWREQDILGRQIHDVHHHSYADGTPYPRENCPIYQALTDGIVHRGDDEVFWHSDGRAIPVEYISTPIREDGRVTGAVAVFRDISERRALEAQRSQAQLELARVLRRHELILGAAGEGVYGLDAEGRATFVNRAATEILGWRQEDILGQPVHDVHHHSHADGSPYPREQCPVYLALTDGKVHREDSEVFWHSDGRSIPVEYTSTPVREEGRIIGAVVVFRDISERRQLEQQREQSFREISRLNAQLERERDYLRDEIRVTSHYSGIVGESQALKRTLEQIEAVAATPVNVLIRGETGVGKEGIARAIHDRSDRADNPLVKVNCASIPAELFESEFFGHVKGAFTGAQRDRVGRLQLADGGTLFLDEVGEVPLALQSKLLRALQEKEFERVGDEHTVRVDVRVIAATNRDLEQEIEAGRFREDLFYRLSVFPIEVPPLRERLDDIGPLAQHFLHSICEELGRESVHLTQAQLAMLEAHDWPGNVRELKNVIERAVVLTQGPKLRLEQVFTPSGAPTVAKPRERSGEILTDEDFRELERANLLAALHKAEGRVSGAGGAAELVGLKPSTMAYRMKKLGIEYDPRRRASR